MRRSHVTQLAITFLLAVSIGTAGAWVLEARRSHIHRSGPFTLAASPSGQAILSFADAFLPEEHLLSCDLMVLDFYAPEGAITGSFSGVPLRRIGGRGEGPPSILKGDRCGWPLPSVVRCQVIESRFGSEAATLLERSLAELTPLQRLAYSGRATPAQLARHRELILIVKGAMLAELKRAESPLAGSKPHGRWITLVSWPLRALNALLLTLVAWLFLETVRRVARRVASSRPV